MIRTQLQLPALKMPPPLDAGFRPAVLAFRDFEARARSAGGSVEAGIAVEQADGSIFHHRLTLFGPNRPESELNDFYLERLVKFLLWSRGGFRVYLAGPKELAVNLSEHYRQTAPGRFDADIMGNRIYEKRFEVAHVSELPPASGTSTELGRHLQGCRIGFDLGGSDRKAAAVIDGECVFSEEVVWNPVPQCNPHWHFDEIMRSLQTAASHLPKVDAIGGSSAGVYVNNRVKVASLFRGVPPDLFESRVKNIFLEIKQAWGGIPFEVVNDGEVTALAGSMALGKNGVLGIAMGTSMAGGYVTPQGRITTWLNELAFAPVDLNPTAAVDEWSGDYGCGVQYFSQQAVGKLLPAAGIELNPELSLPEKLKAVQELMGQGDERAALIFETIGIYLGYTLAFYKRFYEFNHLLLLGRVTSGPGGDLIIEKAKSALAAEFSEFNGQIEFHLPSEKERRHGQAIAAASLPKI